MLDRCNVHTDTGLWMRPAYMTGFQDQSITAVVRRRDRSDPSDVTYIPLGVDVPVRFLKQMGNRDGGIQPALFPDDGTTVCLTERIVKPIQELNGRDLAGGSPDVATAELVRYHIALVDNTLLPDWDEVVTVYHFEHQPKVVDPEAS